MTVLVAGRVAWEVLCVALWTVGDREIKVLHQEQPVTTTQYGEATLDSAFCSSSGVVAFTVGYGRKVAWYQLSANRRRVAKRGSFAAEYNGNGMDVAISDDGERLLCTSTCYQNQYATLFTRNGDMIDSVKGVAPQGQAYRANCILLRTLSRDSRVLAYHFTKGKLLPWCELAAEDGKGLDVKIEDGKTLIAVETKDHTSVCELKDFDQVGLFSNDEYRRETAARLLGERRYKPAREDLIRLLEDSSEGVRKAALEALAALGDVQSLPSLLRSLGRAAGDAECERVIRALGRFERESLVHAVIEGMKKTALQRRGAVLLLRRRVDLNAIDALCEALTDTDALVRITAAHALGARKELRAIVPLLGRLHEKAQPAARDALLEILDGNGYLTPELMARVSGNVDIAAFAEEVVKAQRWRGFDGAAADLLSALSKAAVTSARPLADLMNSLEAIMEPAIALVVALAMAEAWLQEGQWSEAETLFRKSTELARASDAAGIEWQAWQAAAEAAEKLGDDRRAMDEYREAMAVIDRIWFALLREDELRRFFQDKAKLYERASLCALRLGHAAMALEIHEKAKTRYLGDLIARRHMDPRVTLNREWQEFWSVVEGARPLRLPLGSSRIAETPVEIVAVERGSSDRECARICPARLAALRDADAKSHLRMLDHIWRLVLWVARMEDDPDEWKIREALENIYQALQPLWIALETGTLPLSDEESKACARAYKEGGLALIDIHREDRTGELWAFHEYGTGWVDEIARGTAVGSLVNVLGAVREALNMVLRHEPVMGVPSEHEGSSELMFVTRSLMAGSRTRPAQTRVVESALERQFSSQWRHASRLVRGDPVSHQEIAAGLDESRNIVQLELQVTDEGTIVYLTKAARAQGRMPALHGSGLEVYTFNGVSQPILRARLLEGESSWMRTYRARRERGGFDAWKRAMEETLEWLGAELWSPMDEVLKHHKATDVRIVPHRTLQIIPWAAVGTRTSHVVDRYTIECAPSATLQQICRSRSPSVEPMESLTAVVDPNGDLDFAAFEVEQAARLLPKANVRLLRRNMAHIGELMRSNVGAIFHFAGHGNYDWADPLRSSLRFAGGARLRLGELFDEKWNFGKTKLVVLSACETNLVDATDAADECLGMASGFLFAGAAAVLSTLWAVSDMSTALFVQRFYTSFLEEKLSVRCALRTAQLWLKDEVTRPLVIDKLDEVIAQLNKEWCYRPRFSIGDGRRLELEAVTDRIRKRRDLLAAEEKRDPGAKPFAHPYYWAAFTLWGGGQKQ